MGAARYGLDSFTSEHHGKKREEYVGPCATGDSWNKFSLALWKRPIRFADSSAIQTLTMFLAVGADVHVTGLAFGRRRAGDLKIFAG